jgi:DNA topoisomerase-1
MQQQASSLLRINPKATMQCAQRLYEAGHITYMRTDKAVLSEDAKKEGIKWIISTHGEEYVGLKPVKSKKGASEEGVKAQEAHEAIRPTHMDMVELPSTEDWSSIDRKLYRLIWTRSLQSLMSAMRGERRTVEFRIDEEWTWRAIWRRVVFDGWRKLDWKEIAKNNEEGEDEKEGAENEWEFALTLKENVKVSWKNLQAEPHFTKSPARYSEATLIRRLEENGIGRPSTFASLITTILDKNYVEKKDFEAKDIDVETLSLENDSEKIVVTPKKQKIGGEKDRMVPTALGLSVLKYLMGNFDNLFAYEFTASMEKRLDNIAEGREIWKEVIRDTWKSYKDKYEEQLATKSTIKDSVGERRKEFSEGIVAILTKKGPLLLREMDGDPEKTVFYGWPEKIAFQEITEQKAKQFMESQKKTKEGEEMGKIDDKPVIRKKGPYGVYAEWNGKRISCTEATTLEELTEKFKNQESNVLRTIGVFEIRKGPYGNYMFKTGVVKKQFVSVPSTVKIEDLTEASCVAIFQSGLKNKARSSAFGGSRGGFRGRGK